MNQDPNGNTTNGLRQLEAKNIQARFQPVYPEAGLLKQHDALKSQTYEPHLEFFKRIGNAALKIEKCPQTDNVIRF